MGRESLCEPVRMWGSIEACCPRCPLCKEVGIGANLRLAPWVEEDCCSPAGPEGRWIEAGFTVRSGHDLVRRGIVEGTTSAKAERVRGHRGNSGPSKTVKTPSPNLLQCFYRDQRARTEDDGHRGSIPTTHP